MYVDLCCRWRPSMLDSLTGEAPSTAAHTALVPEPASPQDTCQSVGNTRRRWYIFVFWTSQEWGAFKRSQVQIFLWCREEGQGVQQERDGSRREGRRGKDREIKRGREREHSTKCRNGSVYPAGGETISHFLCFGGRGSIFPLRWPLSHSLLLPSVIQKSFHWEVEIHWLLRLETTKKWVASPNVCSCGAERSQEGRPTGAAFVEAPTFYYMPAVLPPQTEGFLEKLENVRYVWVLCILSA